MNNFCGARRLDIRLASSDLLDIFTSGGDGTVKLGECSPSRPRNFSCSSASLSLTCTDSWTCFSGICEAPREGSTTTRALIPSTVSASSEQRGQYFCEELTEDSHHRWHRSRGTIPLPCHGYSASHLEPEKKSAKDPGPRRSSDRAVHRGCTCIPNDTAAPTRYGNLTLVSVFIKDPWTNVCSPIFADSTRGASRGHTRSGS
ncbi:hypothetical protein B0H14DRAFT_1508547 [Mycena olivaceomarginata]|nr:hypothetical protein B0H14DRAFT_1508547 [Mycena olivaceomarginata]